MKRTLILLTVVALCPAAASADSLSITDLAFGTGIENRAVTGVDTVFTLDQGRVYCWTVVTGAGAGDTVLHTWYLGDRQVQQIALAVRGARWRTHSYKTLDSDMAGTWRVEVTDRSGRKLADGAITVSEPEAVPDSP